MERSPDDAKRAGPGPATPPAAGAADGAPTPGSFSGTGALAAAILQTADNLIAAVDPDRLAVIAFNRGLADHVLRDHGRRVALGARTEDLFPPGEAERWRDMLSRALREGPYRTELEAAGGKRVLELVFWPVPSDGGVQAIAVLGRDITDQRRLEVALRQSDARLRALVEHLPVAIVVTRDSRVLYMNAAFRQVFGVRPEADVTGWPVMEYLAPESREVVADRLRLRLAERPTSVEHEVEAVRADGRRFPAHVSIAVVELPDGLASLSVVTDLTDRREAERSVREREAFFRTVLERSPDVAAVIGPGGHVHFVSSSVRAVLGWTEPELCALQDAGQLVHPDDEDRVEAFYRAILSRSDGVERVVCRVRHKDGRYRDMDVTGRNLLHEPTIQGVVVNARDTTEIRRVEEQLRESQKLETVGRLAGGIAHDFNNILTVILSSSESLAQSGPGDDPGVREDLDQIRSAAERARDLTRQLLAFARKQAITPRPVDLNELVASARKMLARLAGEDVELALDLQEGLWPVRVDPAQVDQILLNLVANARDALPRGGRIEIATRNLELDGSESTWPGASPGRYVALRVTDDGTGMAPEVLERAFDPFFTTKGLGQGTGLGLATVHGVVSQNGGRVRVESEPGRGSRFEILFLRTEEESPAPDPSATQPTPGGTESIVLVEDDPAVRRQAFRALTAAGYEVHLAADGLEALEVAAAVQTRPDLLLTDVVMPRLDGPALAERARARWPGIRVLFMSGHADDRLSARGLSTPGTDILQKPFTGTSLLQSVRDILDRQG